MLAPPDVAQLPPEVTIDNVDEKHITDVAKLVFIVSSDIFLGIAAAHLRLEPVVVALV
jgi:hypothetical protein